MNKLYNVTVYTWVRISSDAFSLFRSMAVKQLMQKMVHCINFVINTVKIINELPSCSINIIVQWSNELHRTNNEFSKRLNNQISESRTGMSCYKFPKHVFECGKKNNNLKEPLFKAYAFFALTDPRMLLREESKLFKAGHSLLNS